MDRRRFVKAAISVPLVAGSGGLAKAGQALTEGSAGSVPWSSGGDLGARHELTLHRVMAGDSPAYSEEFLLADVRPEPVRRFTEYSGDLSGRYIGALATAARADGKTFPGLDALVEKVIALQKPDGYFGSAFHYDKPTDADLALLWGNGRLLVGLLEYYRLKPMPQVLAACGRLGDWLVGYLLAERFGQWVYHQFEPGRSSGYRRAGQYMGGRGIRRHVRAVLLRTELDRGEYHADDGEFL